MAHQFNAIAERRVVSGSRLFVQYHPHEVPEGHVKSDPERSVDANHLSSFYCVHLPIFSSSTSYSVAVSVVAVTVSASFFLSFRCPEGTALCRPQKFDVKRDANAVPKTRKGRRN
jgi:hypothetical protein